MTREPTEASLDRAGGARPARGGPRARLLLQCGGWAAVVGVFAVGLSLVPKPDATSPSRSVALGESAGQVRALAFGPGGLLGVAGADGRAWVRQVDPVAGRAAACVADLPGCAVAFSGYGSAVVVGDGPAVSLRDVASGECRAEFSTGGGRPFAVASNADDSALAVSDGRGVTVWLGDEGGPRRLTTPGRPRVLSLAFAPRAGWLATGDEAGDVRVWDLATGRPRFASQAHARGVTSLAFADDGLTLASASNHSDPEVRLWDATTGRPLAPLRGHTAAVQAVAFAPGGRVAATAAADGTVRVWDVAGGRERRTLTGDGLLALAVAFSPDGRRLAAAGIGHQVWLWDLDPSPFRPQPPGENELSESIPYTAKEVTSKYCPRTDENGLGRIRRGGPRSTQEGAVKKRTQRSLTQSSPGPYIHQLLQNERTRS